MGWLHHTNVSPDNDNENKNSFNEAFDIFLQQCLVNKERLKKDLEENNYLRFVIKTDGDNDKIICSDGRFFIKSKFLINKTFKKKLIDYYRPLGIYVNGPKEIKRRDGTLMNRWIIELTPKF